MFKQYLEIGKIVATQGLKGEVRVQPWCDSPDFLCEFKELYYKNGEEKIEIERAYPHKTMAIIKIKGVETVEEAQKLRNKIIFMNRDDAKLEKGQYFIQDLIGLKVVDAESGKEYGELSDVGETGANDIYYIKQGEKTYLIPAIPEVVVKTDMDEGIMYVKAMKGLFEDEI